MILIKSHKIKALVVVEEDIAAMDEKYVSALKQLQQKTQAPQTRRKDDGRVVVEGTPEAVVAAGTHTGVALAPVLARG